MTKLKFILTLHDKLSGLPQDEVEERISFYSEMIEDRMEEGLTEEEAVAAVGSVEDIAAQIEADIMSVESVKEPGDDCTQEPADTDTGKSVKVKRGLRSWKIVLLAIGCPLWLSLLIAAFAVIFSLYVSLWAVIVSIWAAFASLIACALAGVVGGTVLACHSNLTSGISMIGAAFVCAGLSIFLYFGCKAATKGTIALAKWTLKGIKKCFAKKEGAK